MATDDMEIAREGEDKKEEEEENSTLDVVTRIQNEVGNLSYMYYNFTGGLQEMAPPVSVTSERVKVESDTSVEYNAQELATQIVGAHKKIDELIDSLEDFNEDEDEQIKSIEQLQGKHKAMKEGYQVQYENSRRIFGALMDSFTTVADELLNAPTTDEES